MFKQLRNFLFLFLMTCGIFSGLQACDVEPFNSESMYFTDEESDIKQDIFHIHLGNNIWLVDQHATDLFTPDFNFNSILNVPMTAYEKTWKCPYCHKYWPVGVACKNADCPSKYK